MEIFLRPKAPAHAPASHVAWLIALAATPREGHSRSSLVGSWAGVWRSATAQGNGSEEATRVTRKAHVDFPEAEGSREPCRMADSACCNPA